MAEKKPRLGILGGMGPQATQVFYQRILDRTDAECDQEHLPTLILSDTEMPDRTAAILSGKGQQVYDRLLEDARLLEREGCTAIAIPCNTSHYFVDELQRELTVPILHMVRQTCKVLGQRGCKRVGILATDGTVQTQTYQKECTAQGLEGVAPDEETQKLVMSIIYDEIKKGEKGSREKFAAIDRALRGMGCDAAILGCTELSVYRTYHGLPDFYVDALEVLVEQSITACGKRLRTV
jgi:aspartate racemase